MVKKPQPDRAAIKRMVVMGRITAPFGVQGWVKVFTLTAEADSLCDYPIWWLRKNESDWRETSIAEVKVQGNGVVVRFEGVADRDAAAALKGYDIAVPRAALPKTKKNEFYWADLIGLQVMNAEGYDFGIVAEVMETGANDVLVIKKDEKETLIPFLAHVVRKVDLAAQKIEVDWGEDY